MAVSKSEDVKRLMLQMIQEMDLDIVDFRVEEKMYVVGIATFCVLNVNDVTLIALIFKKIFVLS